MPLSPLIVGILSVISTVLLASFIAMKAPLIAGLFVIGVLIWLFGPKKKDRLPPTF